MDPRQQKGREIPGLAPQFFLYSKPALLIPLMEHRFHIQFQWVACHSHPIPADCPI